MVFCTPHHVRVGCSGVQGPQVQGELDAARWGHVGKDATSLVRRAQPGAHSEVDGGEGGVCGGDHGAGVTLGRVEQDAGNVPLCTDTDTGTARQGTAQHSTTTTTLGTAAMGPGTHRVAQQQALAVGVEGREEGTAGERAKDYS